MNPSGARGGAEGALIEVFESLIWACTGDSPAVGVRAFSRMASFAFPSRAAISVRIPSL
jgi:hypothetical protein